MSNHIFLIILIIVILILSGVIFTLICCGKIAKIVYRETLVRTSPDKWSRCCQAPENEEHLLMWNRGLEFAKAHSDLMHEVMVENDGLKLYGEYYDFGYDKAAIIVPGRTESLMYSYYFAIPYYKAHCNILVIDLRAHGKSDGMYDVDPGESDDLLLWISLLQEQFGMKDIILHGICIGAGTCIQILSGQNPPSCVRAFISEGGYVSFPESYRQHMRQLHRPVYPIMPMVMHLIKQHTGCDVYKTRPIDFIDKVHVPTLFLCGMKDLSSLPEKSQQLFDKCGAAQKELVWFEEGAHSHLRIANEDKYDNAVISFLEKIL